MRTDRGLNRLITFVDAVAAIAITLLVLPLIELLAATTPAHELTAVLTDRRTACLVLPQFRRHRRLWFDHHRLAEHVGAYDPAFVLVNFAWLLTIVLLPFATQLVGVYGHDRLAIAAYLATMTVSSACLTMLALLVWRRWSGADGHFAGRARRIVRSTRGRPSWSPGPSSSRSWWACSSRPSATTPCSSCCSSGRWRSCCAGAPGRRLAHEAVTPWASVTPSAAEIRAPGVGLHAQLVG